MFSKFKKLVSKKPVCLGTGLVALDVIYENPLKHSYIATGGSCGNVLTILSQYGWDAYPAAMLGKDLAAEWIFKDLTQFNVNKKLLQRSETSNTPVILEFIEQTEGSASHKFSRTCHISQQKLPRYTPVSKELTRLIAKKLHKFDVYFLDRLTKETLALAKLFRQNNKIVYFEPQTIECEVLFKKMLKVAHVVKISNEQLDGDLNNIIGPELIIQTHGKNGLIYKKCSINGYVTKKLETVDIDNVVDACGSGDWLSAHIINVICAKGSKHLISLSIPELEHALSTGQLISAKNLVQLGARGGMYDTNSRSIKRLKLSNYKRAGTLNVSEEPRPIDLITRTSLV